MLQTLSKIPDHHFSHSKSLSRFCLAHTPWFAHIQLSSPSQIYPSKSNSEDQSSNDSDDRSNNPFYVVVDDKPPPFDGIKRLLDAVLRKGSEKLIVKLL
jgi:hypothetical protein